MNAQTPVEAIPTKAEAYARLRKVCDAKPVSHRNAQDWLAVAAAEEVCSTAALLEYLREVRNRG